MKFKLITDLSFLSTQNRPTMYLLIIEIIESLYYFCIMAMGKRDFWRPIVESSCSCDIFGEHQNRLFVLLGGTHLTETPEGWHPMHTWVPSVPFQCNDRYVHEPPDLVPWRQSHCCSHIHSDRCIDGRYSLHLSLSAMARNANTGTSKLTKQCNWWKMSRYPMTSPPYFGSTWT